MKIKIYNKNKSEMNKKNNNFEQKLDKILRNAKKEIMKTANIDRRRRDSAPVSIKIQEQSPQIDIVDSSDDSEEQSSEQIQANFGAKKDNRQLAFNKSRVPVPSAPKKLLASQRIKRISAPVSIRIQDSSDDSEEQSSEQIQVNFGATKDNRQLAFNKSRVPVPSAPKKSLVSKRIKKISTPVSANIQNKFLIRKLPFQRLVRQITHQIDPSLRFQTSAIQFLQQAAQQYLISIFQGSNLCARHAKREFITTEDIQLIQKIRGDQF